MPKPSAEETESVLGQSVLRLEDRPLLDGNSCFVDDLDLTGALHATILRSPHGHARIRGIDTAAARASEGVVEVLTGADLPGDLRIPMRMYRQPGMENMLQPPLAQDRVRYSGEPIVIVLAESRYLAEDAAERIEVDFEPLPTVLDGREALEPDSEHLFPELGSNLVTKIEAGYGEVDQVFKEAPVVVTAELVCGRHAAVPMEPRGITAEYDPRTGLLTSWGAAKIVHINRGILAKLLEVKEENLRLVELHVGGGFGARGEFYPEDFLIPYCAKRFERPVKWSSDREEDLRTTNHSREQIHEISIAAAEDGTFLGLRDTVTFNTGGYVRTHGTVVPSMTVGLLPGPYKWDAYNCVARQVVTNKTPAGTYRAPGRYEANFARERIIDMLAHKLGKDPLELRKKNLIPSSWMPYETGTHIDGQYVTYDSGDYPKLHRETLKVFSYRDALKWREAETPAHIRRGIGSGWFIEKSGIAKWDYAKVSLGSDAKFIVHAGSTSIGQGVETALAQICAAALGVGYEQVSEVRHGDTAEVPYGMGSFGSRATAIAGSAVHQAATKLRARLLARAAELLEASEDDVRLVDGAVEVVGSPSRKVELADLIDDAHPGVALARESSPGLSEESFFYAGEMSFPYGFHLAAVEVDIETGEVKLDRYAIGYDVGRAVNPQLIEGQIVGGLAQGIGGALLEEFTYTEDGQLSAGSFMDYLMPTVQETPQDVRVLITEDAPSPLSLIGAKGAGEGGTAAAGAAIANAVSDALGAEALRIPLAPASVVELAREAD